MPTIFTVCTTAQLPYARALQASLPDGFEFRIGLIDGQSNNETEMSMSQLIVNVANVQNLSKGYEEPALVAASKPLFAEYFLKETNADQLIYFDPTVQVFGDLQPILEILSTADIVLTPRLTRSFGSSDYADEKFYLNTGLIDAGFWAINRTENTSQFLKWWQERLFNLANLDLCHAQNHDQLWLMYVPVFFAKVQIVNNIGWNVALQNLNERTLTNQNGKWVVNQGDDLLFLNFRELIKNSKTAQKMATKSGVMTLLNNYQKQVDSQPAIFSIHQKLHPVTPKWRLWLQKQLSAIIHRIDSYPLYH